MRIIKICFVIFSASFFAFLPGAKSQNYLEDFKNIYKRYYSSEEQVSYRVKIEYYDMKDLIHPINVIKGDYHLYRSNYSISIGSLKSVANNNMLVTIDTEDKIMIVSNNKTMTVMNSPFLLLDSLIKEGQIDIKKLKGSKEPVRSYRFAFGEDTAVDSMDITYNSTTYLMSELKVFYTNASMLGDETEDYKPVVKFQFYDQEIKNHFDKALFDLNQFVTINNKKVVPNASFKNYQFKNYLKL